MISYPNINKILRILIKWSIGALVRDTCKANLLPIDFGSISPRIIINIVKNHFYSETGTIHLQSRPRMGELACTGG